MVEHDLAGELVLGDGRLAVVLDERDEPVDRRHLCARTAREDVDEADVVEVLVGDQNELEVLGAAPELPELAVDLVERDPGVGTGVDQRQRLVLDQVDVHAPDRERGGYP